MKKLKGIKEVLQGLYGQHDYKDDGLGYCEVCGHSKVHHAPAKPKPEEPKSKPTGSNS